MTTAVKNNNNTKATTTTTMKFQGYGIARGLVDSFAQDEILISTLPRDQEQLKFIVDRIFHRIDILVMRIKAADNFDITSFGRITTVCTLAHWLVLDDKRFNEAVKGCISATLVYVITREGLVEDSAVFILEYYAQSLYHECPQMFSASYASIVISKLKSTHKRYHISAFIKSKETVANRPKSF
jgi:hypothetical protein